MRGQPGDKLDNAIKANVELGVERLKGLDPILSKFVKTGELKVVGASTNCAPAWSRSSTDRPVAGRGPRPHGSPFGNHASAPIDSRRAPGMHAQASGGLPLLHAWLPK